MAWRGRRKSHIDTHVPDSLEWRGRRRQATVSSEYILQAVPEPASIVAACIGLLGVALFRRAKG